MFIHRLKDPNTVMSLGFVFLIIANVGNYFLHRGNAVPESVSDPLSGFLFGVAIATLLVGVWMNSRRLTNKHAKLCPWKDVGPRV